MLRNWLPALRNRSEEALRPVSITDMMEDFWRSPFGAPSLLDEMTKGVFGKGAFPVVNVSEAEKEMLNGKKRRRKECHSNCCRLLNNVSGPQVLKRAFLFERRF